MNVGNITRDKYNEVCKIYLEGITTGVATFGTAAASWDDWDSNHFCFGRIAVEDENNLLGWAALSPFLYTAYMEVSLR